MADASDVETALGALIGAVLYPSPGLPSGASPVASVPVRVRTGWPGSQELQDAGAAGLTLVSVYAPAGSERNTTRYPDTYFETVPNPATYTLTLSGSAIVVGGQGAGYAQNLTVLLNGVAYTVPAFAQTPSDLALALAALLPGSSAQRATVTLPAAARVTALRVTTEGSASREVRRSERSFQITVWAPTPEARVAVAEAFDPVLSDTPRLLLPDGQLARLTYRSSVDLDTDEQRSIFRRDLIYAAEYAVSRTITATQIGAALAIAQDTTGRTLATTWS